MSDEQDGRQVESDLALGRVEAISNCRRSDHFCNVRRWICAAHAAARRDDLETAAYLTVLGLGAARGCRGDCPFSRRVLGLASRVLDIVPNARAEAGAPVV